MGKTSKVTYTVLSSRVELSSVVISGHVQHRLVDEGGDLDVRRRLDHLETGDGALGDETGAVALLGAPRDLLVFGVRDPENEDAARSDRPKETERGNTRDIRSVGIGRCPKAEVYF